MSRTRPRGHTLPEVLLTATLVALLWGMLTQILIPTWKAAALNSARLGLQQQGLMALERILKDLKAAPLRGVGIRPPVQSGEPTVLSIHPITEVTASTPSTPIYATQLTVFTFDPVQQLLRRRVWPDPVAGATSLDGILQPPTMLQPVRPRPESLLYFGQHRDARERILARQVTALEITSGVAAPRLSNPLTLRLRLEQPASGRPQPLSFEVTQCISLREAE